jgi:protein-disulfide isomerase
MDETAGGETVSRRTILLILAAVLIVGGAVGFYLSRNSGGAVAATPVTGSGYDVTASDRVLGNPRAKVVLIEYAAPACPHCARFNATVFPLIKKNYIDNGKIYYVFRVFPISPADGPAEKLARCLPVGKYFGFIDQVFRNQPKWDPEYGIQDPRTGLATLARAAGLGDAGIDRCLADTKADDRINMVAAEGQSRYSITGTPTFILNGMNQGGIDFADLPKLLDAALAQAR